MKNTTTNHITKEKQSYDKILSNTKKSIAEERINELLDKNSLWLELSAIAGYNLYPKTNFENNIICGIGKVNNTYSMIIANKPEIKAGCYFPITIKKHLRAQQIAIDLKLPCVYLVDSAGLYLPMQAESFADSNGFGKIFYNQALLKQKKIQQISIVFGTCVAGGAYIPAMSDEIIMINKQSKMFLAGPALVKAAIGEITDDESLGGAEFHSFQSGVNDYFVNSETEAIQTCRKIIKSNSNNFDIDSIEKNESLYNIIPEDARLPIDALELIKNIVDNNSFIEFKANYATSIITGYATIANFKVAIIANNGALLANSAQKATNFINTNNKKNIPLIFLQNIAGFMVGTHAERSGIIKYGAELIHAISCSSSDKITIMINNSFGAGNYAMCGRAFEANFVWSWPNATTAVMGYNQALSVLSKINHKAALNPKEFESKYKQQSHAFYSSARLWDDGIIDPAETRKILAYSLLIINQKNTCI